MALARRRTGVRTTPMRLIQGDSLHEALSKLRNADARTRTLELHKFLSRFIAMCNALDYAHSRGVLHRDLKPDNVMLGDYGETLVVDWGLAKLDEQAATMTSDGTKTVLLRPPSGSRAAPETKGHAMGTPEYMAPEQAIGDTDEIGVCTDIYGLGAILFHLLTGQAPISGKETGVKLRKAERGEYPKPRGLDPRHPQAVGIDLP